jgi:hypothetical protein
MKTIKLCWTTLAASLVLGGCVTDPQGNLVLDPNVSASFTAAMAPSPQPEVDEVAYEPMPYDANIAVVSDRDVVFVGGSTYIWVNGPDGIRHRQLYAHGDHRADVFHRREELHNVIARHEGRLPDHAIRPQAFASQPRRAPAAEGSFVGRGPGAQPAAVATRGPNTAPARPAPQSRTSEKEKKKS